MGKFKELEIDKMDKKELDLSWINQQTLIALSLGMFIGFMISGI